LGRAKGDGGDGRCGEGAVESAQTLAPDACHIASNDVCVRYRIMKRINTYISVFAEMSVAQRARNRAVAAATDAQGKEHETRSWKREN